MPKKDNLAYLFDIRECILRIERFTEGIASFDQYEKDEKTINAVERQLSIIGEAVIQYTKLEKLENAEKIRGFRNRLIHSYDSIEQEMVWVIIKRHLPPLLEEVTKKLPS